MLRAGPDAAAVMWPPGVGAAAVRPAAPTAGALGWLLGDMAGASRAARIEAPSAAALPRDDWSRLPGALQQMMMAARHKTASGV